MDNEIVIIVVIGSSASFILILVFLLFFIKYHKSIYELKLKKQQIMLEAEINAKESEREKIARNIHDQLGGNLSALSIMVKSLKRKLTEEELVIQFDKIIHLLDNSHQSVRDLSFDLLANNIDTYGLKHALEELLAHSPVKIGNVIINGNSFLDQKQTISLYRIIQEMVNNAVKHSKSKEIHITIEFFSLLMECNFQFDGKGFDLEESRKNSKGIGLKNIDNRISYLQASLQLSCQENLNLYSIQIKK